MERIGYAGRQPHTSGGADLPRGPRDTLTCTGRRLAGAVCVTVSGEVDLGTISLFRTQLRSAAGPTDHVILDFSVLRYIDFSGIHALLGIYERLTLAGRRMALAAVPPKIWRVLTAFGVDEILPVFSTVDAAAADFRDGASRPGAESRDGSNRQAGR